MFLKRPFHFFAVFIFSSTLLMLSCENENVYQQELQLYKDSLQAIKYNNDELKQYITQVLHKKIIQESPELTPTLEKMEEDLDKTDELLSLYLDLEGSDAERWLNGNPQRSVFPDTVSLNGERIDPSKYWEYKKSPLSQTDMVLVYKDPVSFAPKEYTFGKTEAEQKLIEQSLDKLAAMLKQKGGSYVLVVLGSVSAEEKRLGKNKPSQLDDVWDLSAKRATQVARALAVRNVSEENLITLGLGPGSKLMYHTPEQDLNQVEIQFWPRY